MYRVSVLVLFLTVLLLGLPQSLRAQAAEGALPEKLVIDEKQFATEMDEVIVPNPDELFRLMDKLGQHNWAGQIRSKLEVPNTVERPRLALMFGMLIADGFIAVQAKDAPRVKAIGNEIVKIADDLGLKAAVLPHCNAIIEACDQQKWDLVRLELDRTHKTVRDEMVKIRDADMAQFVSIAGWLRGTEILTNLIQQNWGANQAEILNQPRLAEHFVSQLEPIVPKYPEEPQLKDILEGLIQMKTLMSEAPTPAIPADTVTKIHGITAGLVQTIFPTP